MDMLPAACDAPHAPAALAAVQLATEAPARACAALNSAASAREQGAGVSTVAATVVVAAVLRCALDGTDAARADATCALLDALAPPPPLAQQAQQLTLAARGEEESPAPAPSPTPTLRPTAPRSALRRASLFARRSSGSAGSFPPPPQSPRSGVGGAPTAADRPAEGASQETSLARADTNNANGIAGGRAKRRPAPSQRYGALFVTTGEEDVQEASGVRSSAASARGSTRVAAAAAAKLVVARSDAPALYAERARGAAGAPAGAPAWKKARSEAPRAGAPAWQQLLEAAAEAARRERCAAADADADAAGAALAHRCRVLVATLGGC
jgi:hypothetical protein